MWKRGKETGMVGEREDGKKEKEEMGDGGRRTKREEMGTDRGKMGRERKRPGRRWERGREEEMELEGEWDKDGGRKGRQDKGREGMDGGERDDGRW